jgi:hypothetical protein
MSCSSFSTTSPSCRTITTIEPDDTLLSATSTGSTDQSLDESGSIVIPFTEGEDSGETARLTVVFETPKASADYRFEYLYVDVLGQKNVGSVVPIVILQTLTSFTVDLAGIPLLDGYILRWRVVVRDLNLDLTQVDSPENLRVQIVAGEREQVITFVHPRSDTNYGFTELRIENLIDNLIIQRYIGVQVGVKTQLDFTVGFSAPAPNSNYFLVARTP